MSDAIETPTPGTAPENEAEGSPTSAPVSPSEKPSGRSGLRWWVVGVVAVIVGAGLAVWMGLGRGPKDDLGQFQGEWAITTNGRSELGTVRVEGDRWTYVAGGQPRRSYRLTLNPGAGSKEIDLAQLDEDGRPVTFTHGAGKGSEVKLHGVYSVEGDTVRVVLVPGVEPRPTSLDPAAGLPEMLLTRVTH